jgi:hypothetical protein
MRLDELKRCHEDDYWVDHRIGGIEVSLAKIPDGPQRGFGGTVTRCGHYTITYHPTDEAYDDLSAIEAQCVLLDLLQRYPEGKAP